MQDFVQIIKTKSLVIMGGHSVEREMAVTRVKSGWRGTGKCGVFQLADHIKDSDRFIRSVVKTFPVTSPLKGVTKEQMGWDQVNDYFLEWPHELKYNSVLIVIPECHSLYKNDPEYFQSVMQHFFTYANWLQWTNRCDLKIMVTLEEKIDRKCILDDNGYNYSRLPVYFKPSPGRKSLKFDELIRVIEK